MKSQQLLAKVKQYPLAVVCVVVILILGVLTFLRSERIPALEQEYETVLGESELMNANSKNAVDLDENLEKLKELTASIESRLIDPDANTDNYRYFLGMAERTGVDLVDPSTGTLKSAKNAGLKEFPLVSFTLSLSGPYENVLEFLYALRTGRHITRIDKVSIAPSAGIDSSSSAVKASVTISIIGKPQKK